MPETLYCWRCECEVPMLTDAEWEIVRQHLAIKLGAYATHYQRALEIYEQLTGFKETNPQALWHHRIGLLGPPCHVCGIPLRTPEASYCAACGRERSK